MKLRNRHLIQGAAFCGSLVLKGLAATLRVRVRSHDGADHPLDADVQPCIYAFWHESMLAPCKVKAKIQILISRSADGELIAQVAQRMGIGVVRGSTSKGGAQALLELTRFGERGQSHLLFTPDGPRGPRRTVQPGMIFLASRTGLPIVPVGIGFTSAWRARSWDRFAVPLPFSTLTGVVGRPIYVPEQLSAEGLAHYRRQVEQSMRQATLAAERWADRRRSQISYKETFRQGVDHAPRQIGRHVA